MIVFWIQDCMVGEIDLYQINSFTSIILYVIKNNLTCMNGLNYEQEQLISYQCSIYLGKARNKLQFHDSSTVLP